MSSPNGIEEELGALKTDIKKLHSDISLMAQALSSEGKKQWENSRKSVERSAECVYSKVADAVSDISENSEKAIGKVKDEIGKRPLISVAAALGIGYCLGKILRRD